MIRKISAFAVTGALLTALFTTPSTAQVDHSPRWISSTNLTYGLVDLDNFSPGSFASCRWGNYMDYNEFGTVDLRFSPLTAPPYSNSNTDLFISVRNFLARVTFSGQAFPTTAVWTPPSTTIPSWGLVQFDFSPNNFDLYRYLHFRSQLIDKFSGTAVPTTAKKLVIMIHGWNRSGDSDPYFSPEFFSLGSKLDVTLANSDWRLVRYGWEADADTGDIGLLDLLSAAQKPTSAAEIANLHGQHLGELLFKNYPGLEKIQLIAHSAGAWAARSAARYILKNMPNCTVQITFLDPFMPTALFPAPDSVLGTSIMSAFDSVEGNQQLKLLENYFANEVSSAFVWSFGTQETFAWRSTDINQQIDWSGAPQYHTHSGPIQFYTDTVSATLPGSPTPPGLTNAPFDLRPSSSARIGWTKSLFFNEPLVQQSPQNQAATIGSAIVLSVTAGSRNSAASDASPTYQWKRNGVTLTGQTSATLRINSAQATDAGAYSVTVSNFAGSTTSTAATVSVASNPPAITAQPVATTVAAGSQATFSVQATSTLPLNYSWLKNGSPLSGATNGSLTLSNVQPTDAGSYSVVASNITGSVTSSAVTLSVTTTAPTITTQPIALSVTQGAQATFSVQTSSAIPVNYSWLKNGNVITGASNASLILSNVQPSAAGSYSVVVTNSAGSVTSSAATLIVTPGFARLTNVSVRSNAGIREQTLIVGFNIAGSGTKQLLLRGIGPSLGQFGVAGTLADPQLRLFNSSSVQINQNDDWGGSSALVNTFSAVGAFALSPTSRDAALLISLSTGSYTAQLTAATGTGIALVEGYDTDTGTPSSHLSNVSVRSNVGTGAGVLVVGFAITGNMSKAILIRGIGPALGNFGVPGALADPQLSLFNSGSVQIDQNDNWGGANTLNAAFNSVGAFVLANAASRDAALLITLAPGSYTAQVSGVGNTTGVALVEIYEVP